MRTLSQLLRPIPILRVLIPILRVLRINTFRRLRQFFSACAFSRTRYWRRWFLLNPSFLFPRIGKKIEKFPRLDPCIKIFTCGSRNNFHFLHLRALTATMMVRIVPTLITHIFAVFLKKSKYRLKIILSDEAAKCRTKKHPK